MNFDNVSITQAIISLNDALCADSQAIGTLFNIIVPCNTNLSQSNVEVAAFDSIYVVNMIGVLNAIFAFDDDGTHYRIMPYYENNTLVEFRLGAIGKEDT